MAFENLIRNLLHIEQTAQSALDQEINGNLEKLADMQRARLSEGKDTDGNKIQRIGGSDKYTPAYARKKQKLGGKVDRIDLKLSGDYHEGIKAKKISKQKVAMFSEDFKEKFLPIQYKKVDGISEEQAKEIESDFVKGIIRKVKTKITNR